MALNNIPAPLIVVVVVVVVIVVVVDPRGVKLERERLHLPCP